MLFYLLAELLYTMTASIVRLSICLFFLRICAKKLHKRIVYGTLIVVLLYSIVFSFIIIFQCKPVNYFWRRFSGAHGTCLSVHIVPNLTFVHGAICAGSDWILGLFPILLMWNLKMNIRTKIAVGAVLSLGVV